MNFTIEEKQETKQLLAQKAELFKLISHPVRLCILTILYNEGRSNVTDMQLCIDVSQSTVSQHIAKLKAANIISGQREGTEIYYSIKDPDVKQIMKWISGRTNQLGDEEDA